MHLSRWWLTGFLSTFVFGCSGGLFIGDGPDGGPSTAASTGAGGSSAASGGAGGTTVSTTVSTTTTAGGGGGMMTSGAGGSVVATTTSGGGMMQGTGGADSGMMQGTGGADGGTGTIEACTGWTSDAAFSMLRLDNTPLGRVYDVWGLSDNDYYVALGVETASWPNSSQLTALAHYDGHNWTLVRFPLTTGITQLTGTASPGAPQVVSQLWALAGVSGSQLQANVFRSSDTTMWTSETVTDPAYGLVALGADDAILSVYTHSNAFIGDVRRWNGMQWVSMILPDVGVPYAFRRVRMRDVTHVYGVGYSGGATMGSHVLGAFDGSQWRAHLVDDKCGNLEDVVGVAPDRIYTLGTVFSTPQVSRICRVSPDLATWNIVDEFPFALGGQNAGLVASGGGSVVTVVGTYMTHGPSTVRTMQGDMPRVPCTLTPGLGQFVAWSAPGSPNVHIFTGEQAGVTMSFARHMVARVDP